MNEVVVVMLAYLGVFILALLVINFLMTGFFFTYMRVKGSRGAKILTNVVTVSRNYYRVGFIDNGFFVYKDANKHEKRMKIPEKHPIFYRSLNVTCVNVNEERNIFVQPNGEEVSGFDAEKYNNLYVRTLYRPELLDPKQQLMFFLTIANSIMLVIVAGTILFMVLKKLDLIIVNTTVLKSYFVGLNATII